MSVGKAGRSENVALHGVVGGQVAEVDKRSSLHIWNAALPQRFDATAHDDLPEGVRRAVNSRLQPHQPPSPLHLNVNFDEVGGRRQPLSQAARGHSSNRWPKKRQVAAVVLELFSEDVVGCDPNTAAIENSLKWYWGRINWNFEDEFRWLWEAHGVCT